MGFDLGPRVNPLFLRFTMTLPSPLEALLTDLPLRSASFIVTVYGDVVVPRGEVLWMGNLIEICARVGISESLVRTATSRLVQGGRLEGERIGRRSYYRLAPAARAEFSDVARLIYRPATTAKGWLILHAPELAESQVRRLRLGRIEPGVWISPDFGQAPIKEAVTIRAGLPQEAAGQFAQYWQLQPVHDGYCAFIARFAPLLGRDLPPADALIARLLLVEVYRSIILSDPNLPASSLPSDWKGAEARSIFAKLYTTLSEAADPYIGTHLEGEHGPLPARTQIIADRLQALV